MAINCLTDFESKRVLTVDIVQIERLSGKITVYKILRFNFALSSRCKRFQMTLFPGSPLVWFNPL